MKHKINYLFVFTVFLLSSQAAFGMDPVVTLKEFDYNELALLQIKNGADGKYVSCFYGKKKGSDIGKYVWIAEKSEISIRNAFVKHIRSDHIEIDEVIGINGVDWVSVQFRWPVAGDAQYVSLRKGCGTL